MAIMMVAFVNASHPAYNADSDGKTHTQVQENLLYEGLTQWARTHKFYKVEISNKFYDFKNIEHLTFKVIADGFGSDPDIYIHNSSQPYPTSPANSKWFCEKKGSDTCILRNGQFRFGETLYFSIFCVENCNYKLRIVYAKETDLTAANRFQHKFQAYTTNILKFTIPELVGGKNTNSLEVIVEPEQQFSEMEIYMSLDQDFRLIEEVPSSHFSAKAVALKFSKLDTKWCTKCTVYFILNIERGDRYYITTTSRTSNDQLSDLLPGAVYANPFHQECYSYFILRANHDLVVSLEGYQGQADFYLAPRVTPDGPRSSAIKIRASQGPYRQVVMSAQDRRNYDFSTGTVNFCVYPYTPFSGQLKVKEQYNGRFFDAKDGIITTQLLGSQNEAYNWTYTRYNNPQLNKDGSIYVYFETQGASGSDLPPKVWYYTCKGNSDYCYFDTKVKYASEFSWIDGLKELTGGKKVGPKGAEDSGIEFTIPHKGADCTQGATNCYIMFLISNPNAKTVTTSFMIQASLTNPGDIYLSRKYVNDLVQGNYFYYEISQTIEENKRILPYLDSLTVKLKTTRGDADLFVSTDLSNQNPTAQKYNYQSRNGMNYDQVIITRTEGQTFPQNIFIGIFGSTYCQYEISFETTHQPSFNADLEKAVKVAENKAHQEIIPDEYGDPKLYQYDPWWSGKENRTIAFLADVLANKVTFYTDWNKFPKHFETAMHDVNDSIAILGSNPYHHNNGSFYIRVRPDFELADLLSSRQYIYDFYAFSMAPAVVGFNKSLGFDTLTLGQEIIGMSNHSVYQEYRYFMMKAEGVYNITLKRVPGQGDPIFFATTSNSDDLSYGARQRKEKPSAPMPGTDGTTQTMLFTQQDRNNNPRCGTISHSAQQDGSQACFIVISVTCDPKVRKQCAYRLKIEQQGFDSSKIYYENSASEQGFSPPPPQSIITQDYVNGKIAVKNQINYFFMPVNHTKMKEVMILVNKTKMSNLYTNADSKLMVRIQRNIDKFPTQQYSMWNYTAFNKVDDTKQISATGNAQYPEIVEICEETLSSACKDARGCAILAGVVGTPEDGQLSEYRIRGYYGINKLKNNKPFKVEKKAEDYKDKKEVWDYYWFVISDTAEPGKENEKFAYHVAVASTTGGDPDLFMSLMDGREPSTNDFDLSSQKKGADFLDIHQDSEIWGQKGWQTRYGVAVVVGVRTTSNMTYTLIMNKPGGEFSPEQTMKFIKVGDVPYNDTLDAVSGTIRRQDQKSTRLFMLYNWEHKDFSITLKMDQADGTIMIGRSGQLDFQSNVFTGTPVTEKNSDHYYHVKEGAYVTTNIKGDECYTCWYFVRLYFNSTKTVGYKLSSAKSSYAGTNWKNLKIGSPETINQLNSQWTFTLDSMQNWEVVMTLSEGDAVVQIGTDTRTIVNSPIWRAEIPQGSLTKTAKIRVQQTDFNFNLGTTYYVNVQKKGQQNLKGRIQLIQDRAVYFVGNNKDYTYQITHPIFNAWRLAQKFTFMTVKEQVKFHVFQVPPNVLPDGKTGTTYHNVTMYLTPLTENLYFSVYLNRTGFDKNAVNEFSSLKYPTVQTHLLGFTSQPIFQVDKAEKTMIINFFGKSEQQYTYYTCSIYQQNWGLTNILKAEYQLRIETEIVSEAVGTDRIKRQIEAKNQTEATVSPSTSSSSGQFAQGNDGLWHFGQVQNGEFIQ